jgi:hypothetical protein
LPIRLSGGEGGLASRLPDGRWAMVLPSGWLAAPLPSLAAGDRIELMAYQAGQPADEAGVIVSAVEVLEVVGPPERIDGLALAVTLQEAEVILYARTNGFTLLPLLRRQGG